MSKIDSFHGIRAVALEIAYDNGMIYRGHTQEEWLAGLDPVLGADGVYETDLVLLDMWCQSLSEKDQRTLAAGGQDEPETKAVIARCPRPDLLGLFDDIFEGVSRC